MKAGRLRHRITLQTPPTAQDGRGQVDEFAPWVTWAADVPAEVTPLRGRELFAAQQINAEADVRFTIRYRPGVLPTMRVLWRGEAYEIVSPPIEPKGAMDAIELMCRSGIRNTDTQ